MLVNKPGKFDADLIVLGMFDRPQRLTIAYLWAVPGPRSGWAKYPLGGWQVGGITTFQSGTPFSVANGSDRNNDGILGDRPDIGNPNAPVNTRAIIFPKCPTGYQKPRHGLINQSRRCSLGGRNWIPQRRDSRPQYSTNSRHQQL